MGYVYSGPIGELESLQQLLRRLDFIDRDSVLAELFVLEREMRARYGLSPEQHSQILGAIDGVRNTVHRRSAILLACSAFIRIALVRQMLDPRPTHYEADPSDFPMTRRRGASTRETDAPESWDRVEGSISAFMAAFTATPAMMEPDGWEDLRHYLSALTIDALLADIATTGIERVPFSRNQLARWLQERGVYAERTNNNKERNEE